MEITQTKWNRSSVAKLARLDVSDGSEKTTFARQLSGILAHIDQLKDLDTTGVEPTATVLGPTMCFATTRRGRRCRTSRRWPTRRIGRRDSSACRRFWKIVKRG